MPFFILKPSSDYIFEKASTLNKGYCLAGGKLLPSH